MSTPLRIAKDYVPYMTDTPVFAHGRLWHIGDKAEDADKSEEPMTQERMAEAWGMSPTAVAKMKRWYPHKYRYLVRYGKDNYEAYRHRITERIASLAMHIQHIYDAYRHIERTEGIPYTTAYNIIRRAKRGAAPIKYSSLLRARKVLRALERYQVVDCDRSGVTNRQMKSIDRYAAYLKHTGAIA